MARLRLVAMAAALVVVSGSACQNGASTIVTSPKVTQARATSSIAAAATDFDPNNFDHSTVIHNRWLPLIPGTQFVYEGQVNQKHKRLSHRVVLTVTDLTKVADGVRTVVIWDRDYTAGKLIEGDLVFFAQDNDGNVWLMGEYPEEYEDGKFVGAADTWIAGLAGARAGIMMRALPAVSTPEYLQGWAPDIDFADHAKIRETGQSDCVPFGCFENVLVTDEWNPDEPKAHALKYYAPGVGSIRVGFADKDTEQEGLVLVKVVHMTQQALAEIRRGALELEKRAYVVSKDLYGQTEPAEPASGA
jgi:hypothetical protein